MNISWVIRVALALWLLSGLSQAEPKAESEQFQLQWYGPQSSSVEHPSKPTRETVKQRSLFVFKHIPTLTGASFSLKMTLGLLQLAWVQDTDLFVLDPAEMIQRGQVLNFTEYEHMEPEENDGLVAEYFNTNHSFLEIYHKEIKHTLRPDPWVNMLMTMYLSYPTGNEERLTTSVTQNGLPVVDLETGAPAISALTYLIYKDPIILGITPTLGPSQGGTALTVTGRDFMIHDDALRGPQNNFFKHYRPLIRYSVRTVVKRTEIDGYEVEETYWQQQFSDVAQGWNTTHLFSSAVPQLLNDTDATLNVSLAISFNRQNWFDVGSDFTSYDPTRIGYYNVLTIAQMTQMKVLWAGPQRKLSGNGQQLLMAVPESPQDTNKLWLVLPAHGVSGITAGAPVKCGSRIRLQHVRSMKNMHSSFEDSPTLHQQDSSIYGQNGYGDTGDDWFVECEPNLEHEYPYDWESLVWDKRLHAARFDFVMRNRDRYWQVDSPVRFRHQRTEKYLTLSGISVSKEFCSDCQQKGYAAVTTHTDQAGNHQRWFVSRSIDVPVECPVGQHQVRETLSKRWKVSHRPIRVNDFVVWRTKTTSMNTEYNTHACDVSGKFRFGKVMQLFRGSGMLTVSEFFLQRGIFSTIQSFEAPNNLIIRHTVAMTNVHGPLVSSMIRDTTPEIGSGIQRKPGRELVRVFVELLKEHQILQP